jgi:hypothetical protein
VIERQRYWYSSPCNENSFVGASANFIDGMIRLTWKETSFEDSQENTSSAAGAREEVRSDRWRFAGLAATRRLGAAKGVFGTI